MSNRLKSGRMRVTSFPMCFTTNRALATSICERYSHLRSESKLVAHVIGVQYEVRLEMSPGREKPFSMDEVNWAQGFVTGFEANWKGG